MRAKRGVIKKMPDQQPQPMQVNKVPRPEVEAVDPATGYPVGGPCGQNLKESASEENQEMESRYPEVKDD